VDQHRAHAVRLHRGALLRQVGERLAAKDSPEMPQEDQKHRGLLGKRIEALAALVGGPKGRFQIHGRMVHYV
jgi:hypothetical protein